MGILGAVIMSFFLCGSFVFVAVSVVFVAVSVVFVAVSVVFVAVSVVFGVCFFFVRCTDGERIKLLADFENGHTIFLSPIKR
jgi:hypothetical protein